MNSIQCSTRDTILLCRDMRCQWFGIMLVTQVVVHAYMCECDVYKLSSLILIPGSTYSQSYAKIIGAGLLQM